VALGVQNSVHTGLQVSLVDGDKTIPLQAVVAAMLFSGVIVQAGV